MIYENATIVLERMRSSRNGNPRYRVAIVGTEYRTIATTRPNASLGYTIQSYTGRRNGNLRVHTHITDGGREYVTRVETMDSAKVDA